MNLDEFVKKYKGTAIDYDGSCGAQCVDLIKLYSDKVLGLKLGAIGNAHCYFDDFKKHKILTDNFIRISNYLEFKPQKGDICVWGTTLSKYGHVAIATGSATLSEFKSYDMNWGGKEMKEILHSYKHFLGVLRPVDQNKINEVVKETTKLKSNNTIAKEVIKGKWGNGTERKNKLEAAGYNYKEVQAIVNKLLTK